MPTRARRTAAAALLVLVGACSSSSDGDTAVSSSVGSPAGSDAGSGTSSDVPTTPPASSSVAPTEPPSTPDPTTPATPATTATTEAHATLPDAGDGADYPEQAPDVPYPTGEWPIGELPAGVDAAAIDEAVADAFGEPDAEARVRSLLVVEGGELVYERYHPLDSADVPTPSFSVAKSVTSAVVGMLIGDGLLELDAPAPVEEWQAEGDPRRDITLEDLLRMSSGLEWEEDYGPGSVVLEMLQTPHAAEVPISQELVVPPGTEFEYSTGTTAILADIAADQLGGGDALDTYVHERLLDPLGMTSTVLVEDATGVWLGGLGADSTPRDYARFGLLFLRGGVWDGERILPEDWVDASRSPSPTNPMYGLQWWIDEPNGVFSALGLFGQVILVAPDEDLVIVATSTQGGDPHKLTRRVLSLFAAAG